MLEFATGKRDPKNAPSLKFARYHTGIVPTFPAVDYLSQVDWSPTMNGNNKAGDCVSCGVSNLVLLFSTIFAGVGIHATLDEVIAFYKTQNPGFDYYGDPNVNGPGSSHDGGMDEQTACEELVKNGIKIGGKVYKAVGFAQVDHTNLAEIKAAISIAGGVLFGVQVANAQQSQFPGVWDYVKGSPNEGGHAIIGGGHKDVATNDVKAACWAAEFGTTDAFLTHQLDECWLILFDWHLGVTRLIAGMDMSAFAADYTAITGRPFPAVVPTPNPPGPVTPPAPVPPAPVPDAVDAAYWASIKHVVTKPHRLTPGSDEYLLITGAHDWALRKGYSLAPGT